MDRRALVIGVVLATVIESAAGLVAAQTTIPLSRARFYWDWAEGIGVPATEFLLKCGSQNDGVYTRVVSVKPTRRDVLVRDVIDGPGIYYCVVTAVSGEDESTVSNMVVFRRRGRMIIIE